MGLLLCLPLVFASIVCAADDCGLILAERGRGPSFSIVLPDRPSPATQYAAEELQYWIGRQTGVSLPLATNAAPARAVMLECVDDPDLGSDGFRIRAERDVVRISGSAERGILYGVYELLETCGGIGWFSSWHTVVPDRDRFVVPSGFDIRQVPAFAVRDPFFHDANNHSEFAARLRKNADLRRPRDAKFGETDFRCGEGLLAHTFGVLMPPEKYFDEHPEYFSEVGGIRVKGRTQLCLTNPDVERVFAENFLAAVRWDPGAKYYSVSHNDWPNWCTCANCRAINEAEGSPAGTELRFANRMAEILEREFPGKMVKFSSYMYTQRPPKLTRPRPNVLVSVNPIHCDFSRPLAESPYAENVRFVEDLRGWGRLSGNLIVWEYVAGFGGFQTPFPNVLSLRENLCLYRDNSVKVIFSQGNNSSSHADFAELKTWLLGKLMWNPDQPLEPLLQRFFTGFYGPAAPAVRRYFDELHALPRNPEKMPLKTNQRFDTPFLTDAFLDRALGIWDEAEAAAADEPAYLRNVRIGKISVVATVLQRQGARVSVTRTPYPSARIRGLAGWMVRALDDFGSEMEIWEGQDIASFHESCRQLADPARVTPPRSRATAEIEDLCVLYPNYRPEVRDDPSASGGKAVRLPNRFPRVWSVQIPMSYIGTDAGCRYRFRIRARLDRRADAPDGEAVESGVTGGFGRIKASEMSGDYRWFTVAECVPERGQSFFIASGDYDVKTSDENPAFDWLWVDQVGIERLEER